MQSQSPIKNAQGGGGIINPPPGLAPPIISNNIDDDEDEEEMVSLGLSRDSGSFLASINSKDELDESISSNNTANINPPPGISLQPPVNNNNNMVGMNRKSAFPATPAAGIANNNSRVQRVGNNAGAPIVRRTPGPMSTAHQARHRRTPGPPGKHQQYTVSPFILYLCVYCGGLWLLGGWGHRDIFLYFFVHILCIFCSWRDVLVVWFVLIYITQLLNINGWMYMNFSRGILALGCCCT